jgi:hypothetical protein
MPTGSPVTRPSGTQLPRPPGGSLNEITTQKSNLSIGSIRRPDSSWFTVPGLVFARLVYVLATRQDVDYSSPVRGLSQFTGVDKINTIDAAS